MDTTQRIWVFPTPDQTTLWWVLVLALVFLCVAVLIEVLRRRRERQLAIQAEWRAVRHVMEERDFSSQEEAFLNKFIQRYSPRHPFRAITVRQRFNACVDNHISGLERLGNENPLKEAGLLLRDIRIRLGLDFVPNGIRIHSSRELSPGQHLWISATTEDAEWHPMTLFSVDEAFLRLAMRGETTPPFQPGDPVRFRMWREEDARYLFTGVLLHVEEAPQVWVFRHVTELNRRQSRAFFRILYNHPASVSVLNAPLDGNLEDLDQRRPVTSLRGRFTSISAGGFSFLSPNPVPRQVLFRIMLDLEDEEEEALVAHARLVSNVDLSSGQYLIRASFVAMHDEDRDRIARYISQKQPKGLAAYGGATEEG